MLAQGTPIASSKSVFADLRTTSEWVLEACGGEGLVWLEKGKSLLND